MTNAAEPRWESVRALLRARRDDPAFERVERDRELPASFGQERLWLLDQLQPNGNAYNLAVDWRLEGPLDVAALQHSLTAIVDRHEILRTTLARAGGALVQVIAPPSAVPLPVDEVVEGEVEAWAAVHAARPFDLRRGPLFRARLARLGARDHRLLLAQHHAIFDAWSFELFMGELCALYGACVGGQAPPPAAARLAYADFAAWQRRQIAGGSRDAQLTYWTRRLGGALPDLRLPTDRPRARGLGGRAASLQLTVGAARAEALRALARREGATLYMVLLAAFQTLLHRTTGEEDIIVGTPVANRNRAELQAMLGLLTNTVALRTDLRGTPAPTFRELLGRVRQSVSEALAHQDLPFELVVKALRAAHPSRAPLFRVMFALQNVPRSSWSWPGLTARARDVPAAGAKVDLALTMQEQPDGIAALAEYDADLFDAATIARMMAQLDTLLGAIAADPDRPIAALPLLEPDERRRVLTLGNDTAAPYPRDSTLHRLFEREARRAPEATALIAEGERLSYDQLERRTNRLARRLRALQLGPEALVGVWLDRSPDLIVAMLAILKAGAAYLPVDRASPPARAARLLARAAAIVTDASGPPADPLSPVVRVDDPTLAGERDDALDDDGAPTRTAYVMFTSGSTGAPRGVCVPHRAVVRLARGADYARLDAAEVFLQVAPPAFDASTFEIWGALLNGATLVVAPARPLSVSELGALVERWGVTTLLLTSGLFERVVDGGGLARMGSLRQLLTGGDVMSPAHAVRFLHERPGCRLLNAYGPTENTTLTTVHAVDRVEPGRAIPIGKPIANTKVYVLDGRLEPVPLGGVGEAYAGGDGLARGYLDDPDATRARFIANPFAAGETLYRTGDLVRQRPDGVLEFVGRIDDQVKIRGHRVEPAEVERALGEHPGVAGASVRAEARAGDRRLVAHVVPRHPGTISAAELRSFLRARLPDYLVPAEIALATELPITGNGKRDRTALSARPRAPAAAPRDALARDALARDALEQRLAALVAAVLRRAEIGRHDDLTEAGLDSLSALELAVAIERETGRPFALATLFDGPTVAELASALRGGAPAGAPLGPGVMRIRDALGPRPLFLVASGRGEDAEALIFARLAARLPPDEPVLALLAPPAGDSAQEIAASYVATIRRLQPRGPYRLGGQCIGGVAAYEVARQLRAAGEEIELLLLVDSWCPSTAGAVHDALVGRPRALLKAGLAFLLGLPARVSDGEPWPRELWRRAVPTRAARRHMRALRRYRPPRYAGEVTLIASAESLRLGICDAWRALAGGGLVVHGAPGDHESYFKRHFQETAEVLRLCLEEHARRGKAAS